MSKKLYWLLPTLTICALVARPALAQQAPASTKPDSPEVQAHIEKAKKIAGTYWAQAEHFLCEAPRATQAADPGPVKLFDNFWAIPGLLSPGKGVEVAIRAMPKMWRPFFCPG